MKFVDVERLYSHSSWTRQRSVNAAMPASTMVASRQDDARDASGGNQEDRLGKLLRSRTQWNRLQAKSHEFCR